MNLACRSIVLPHVKQPDDLSLIVGGPKYRYRDQVVGTTNASQWTDYGNSGSPLHLLQATGANQPAINVTDSQFASQPTLQGNGTSQFLQAAAATDWKFLHDGSGVSVLVVYRCTGGSGNQILLDTCGGFASAVGISIFQDATNGRCRVIVCDGSGSTVLSTNVASSAANNVTHWVLFRHITGTFSQYVDNVQIASGAGGTPSASNPAAAACVMKSATASSLRLTGKIAEVAIWASYLPNGAIPGVRAYVSRFGL